MTFEQQPPLETTEAVPFRWGMVGESLRRPYRVTFPMILLVCLVPVYLFLPDLTTRPWNIPALPLDDLFPLQPAWALVYGCIYGFLIVLPVFVVREEAHISRTVYAYLTIWLTAYLFFVLYPTEAPRPAQVPGSGFLVWSLRTLYDSDPPYNCFPSLHVAHSFVSAFTIHRVHKGVGAFSIVCAALVGLSTLFTKQHYVLDVIAGVLLAFIANVIFLRKYPREKIPHLDRRLAPVLAAGTMVLASCGIVIYWVAYLVMGGN